MAYPETTVMTAISPLPTAPRSRAVIKVLTADAPIPSEFAAKPEENSLPCAYLFMNYVVFAAGNCGTVGDCMLALYSGKNCESITDCGFALSMRDF